MPPRGNGFTQRRADEGEGREISYRFFTLSCDLKLDAARAKELVGELVGHKVGAAEVAGWLEDRSVYVIDPVVEGDDTLCVEGFDHYDYPPQGLGQHQGHRGMPGRGVVIRGGERDAPHREGPRIDDDRKMYLDPHRYAGPGDGERQDDAR